MVSAGGELTLRGDDRLLVIAPHPGRRVARRGLTLQRAVKAGALVHVALVTLGDAFGYPGPAPVGKRGAARRVEGLGLVRRQESLRALGHLGISPEQVTFLGYPDRGLAALWREPLAWRRPVPLPLYALRRIALSRHVDARGALHRRSALQ